MAAVVLAFWWHDFFQWIGFHWFDQLMMPRWSMYFRDLSRGCWCWGSGCAQSWCWARGGPRRRDASSSCRPRRTTWTGRSAAIGKCGSAFEKNPSFRLSTKIILAMVVVAMLYQFEHRLAYEAVYIRTMMQVHLKPATARSATTKRTVEHSMAFHV